MLERQNFVEIADPKERAADFLRRSLISHRITSKVISNLRGNDPDFQERFTLAQTPLEVLQAVSASGSQRGKRVVELFVDKWVNHGNNKNPTLTRQIIASDFETWTHTSDDN